MPAAIARLAREHGVNANQVFSWHKLYEAWRLVDGKAAQGNELLPVVVTTPAQPPEAEPAPASACAPAGIITLEIGRVWLRIEGQANVGTLAQVLERVLR